SCAASRPSRACWSGGKRRPAAAAGSAASSAPGCGTRWARPGPTPGSRAPPAGLLVGGKAATRGGGWLGGFLGTVLRNLMGAPGAYLVIGVALVISLVLATGVSALDTVGRLGRVGFGRVRAGSSWILARLRRRPRAAADGPMPARGPLPP